MKRQIGKLSTHLKRRPKEAWNLSAHRAAREGNAWIASWIASIKAHKGRKDWPDPLIDAANKLPPEKELTEKEKKKRLAERKLRAYLRTIVRFKHVMIPRKILKDLERVYKKTRIGWHPELGLYTYTMPHSYDIRESTFDIYMSELIFRLRDPAWVAALRRCAACGKLLLSLTKWENRYCSEECQPARKRISARKTRRRAKKYSPTADLPEMFKCPGNDEDMTIEDCIKKRPLFIKHTCPTCPHFTKKGE